MFGVLAKQIPLFLTTCLIVVAMLACNQTPQFTPADSPQKTAADSVLGGSTLFDTVPGTSRGADPTPLPTHAPTPALEPMAPPPMAPTAAAVVVSPSHIATLMPTATATPIATPTPTADPAATPTLVPTPILVPTPTSMPTAMPTPTATPEPTLTPTPTRGPFSDLLQNPSLPSYIKWDVGSEVDRSDVESAIRGVELMQEFAKSLGLPDPASPITITIYKDLEKMARSYSAQTGWSLEKSRKYWENGGGVSGWGSVHISGATPVQLESAPYRMVHKVFHELTHAHFQTGLTGFSRHRTGMSPRWLGEGTANLVTTLLLDEHYPGALNQGRRSWRAEAIAEVEYSGLQLRDAEVWPPNEGGRIGVDEAGLNIIDCIYSCGYVAAELLASQVGMSKLFDYYKYVEPWMEPWDYAGDEENPRREWRAAFERAYGMPLEEFYDLFEEHQAAGFPEVTIPGIPDLPAPAVAECEEVAEDPVLSANGPASPDRGALVALFNATCGLTWDNNEGWLTAAPVGEWHGVTVDGSGRVVGLDLRKNNLRGEIPTELSGLTHLTRLLLSGNRLVGKIPPQLGNLANLEGIWLNGNRLSGPIAPELGGLENLWALEIGGNQLTGPIPAELGNLANLYSLVLSRNQLIGPIPDELSRLTGLKLIKLEDNQLSGCLPHKLGTQLDPDSTPGVPICPPNP